jgi:hypothetical protein
MTNTGTTLIIACGAIAHELVSVIKLNQLDHISIQCLPAAWHNTPDKIAPAVEAKILEFKGQFKRILIAYGDCGTGGLLDSVIERHAIERLPGDHCYSFFAGQSVFDEMADRELGTFYLTDYLVDHFERLVLQDLGINDHPELRDMYFANYTRVMYLCQTPDNKTYKARMQKAQAAADALNLPLETHVTGLAPFEHALRTIAITAA